MNKVTLTVEEAKPLTPEREVVKATASGLLGLSDLPALQAWGQELNEQARKHSCPTNRPIAILLDIQELEGYNSPEILSALVELMKADKPFVYKTATYGGTKTHELIQQILEEMAERDNLKNFPTETEAIAWLKE
ncbi:MAG: hypothetical protein WC250_02235 [Candidatus Paceibacterota bacterium]|jgi:hypothetical protein